MQKIKYFKFAIVLLVLTVVCSCTSKKKIIYFSEEASQAEAGTKFNNPVFRKDDLLSITVMGLDPEAIAPFNMPLSLQVVNSVGGYAQGAPTPPGYLIDGNGEIDFPVIGKIQLAGLTRSEAVELLKTKLGAYIAKPSVVIRILNYKITVLGEVRNPGTFTIPNERITLLEALGIAGDLQITGQRKNVLVLREIDGKKTQTRIDLTSNDVFNSPVYYLQQNDVVYVEPNRAKMNSSVVNAANIGIAVSVLSLLITMATLLSR